MKTQRLRALVLSALLAALICVVTMYFQIPMPPKGYFNLGDCFVLLGAFLLPAPFAACAGGIGSMLADLLLGYSIYAPATLAVKALMALVAASLFRLLRKRSYLAALLGALSGEVVMAGGYFLFELALYGTGTASANLLATNLPQGIVGFVSSVLLFSILEKTRLAQKIRGGFTTHVR